MAQEHGFVLSLSVFLSVNQLMCVGGEGEGKFREFGEFRNLENLGIWRI